MTKFNLKAALAAAVATTFFATPALAQAVPDAEGSFQANATIVKPLTMTVVDSMEFGSLTLLPTLTATESVSVYWDSAANAGAGGAARTCSTNITCGGTALVPNIRFTGGVGSQTIDLTYDPPASLDYVVAGVTQGSLPFTLDSAPPTLALSGGAGDFYVGGTIQVAPNSPEGTYTGTVDIDADYQ